MKNKILASTLSANLVFVDSAVEDFYRLTSSVASDTKVFILHPAASGIAQITTVLKDYSQVSSIHLVSHGSSGHLSLGNDTFSLDSLADYRQDLQQWQNALTPDANLLIYGCNVAAGDRGRTFVEQLQRLVGRAIAASSTLIGNAAQGVNWLLDVTIGTITAPLAFSAAAMAAYPASLVDTFIDEDFSDASSSTPPPDWKTEVITGDPAVDQWRFDNPKPRPLPTFFTTPAAIFDSDFLSNNDQKEDVALETPVFDASGESQIFLQFDQKYVGIVDPDYGSEAFVEVYNGKEWKVVADQIDDVTATTRLDISKEAAGVKNAQVRFRYTGNWSQYWAIDNVKVVNALTPGVTVLGNPQVSEDHVPDTRNFKLVLDSKPTSDVTIKFTVDGNQLKPIASLTFTPDNWNITQTARVDAIADGIEEGNEQTSAIQISVSSADSDYSSLKVKDATASITDHAIPGFISYRTVEKTYSDLENLATANPTIASWLDIGDSYDKLTPGGADGYDLRVLELTNKQTHPAGGKPVLYVEAGIHSREYSTNEVLTRFAEQLVANYGIDPDTTWLLDYFQLDLNPVVNPDGRKFAEQGYLWRKNTNPNPPAGADPADFPNYGVDLNRNHTFEWGAVEGGSSGDPSSEVYRGDAAASEPETQAVENFVSKLYPNRQGASRTQAASEDSTGLLIDLHSFGNTVLYPWGSTSDPAPNKDGLRNLGLKFGYYTNANGTPYDVYQAIGLYPTDGTTDDWAYGTFGIPGYTWELGTDFFETSEYFEKSIAPQVIPALFYAAKSVYRPYQTGSAPESLDVSTDLAQVVSGTVPEILLKAKADGTRYADSNADGLDEGKDLPTPTHVAGARYSIDCPSWIAGTKTYELAAADGSFDSPTEDLVGTIDATKLSPGRHTIFVESKNANGTYGVPTAVFVDVLNAPKNAVLSKGNAEDNQLVSQCSN
ncbi:MAG TPA: DUF4347 domain-containing protein, partial [Coleofasciculaceae cyanobacterium]